MLLAIAVAAAVSALAWPVYGHDAFIACLKILAPLGAGTSLLGSAIAEHRGRIGGLRRQIGLLAILASVQLAIAVALFAELMFVSKHDAFFMALVAGYAALLALAVSRLVAGRALTDLSAVRAALVDVGDGARELNIGVRGRDELAALAGGVEAMAFRLAAEERARRQLIAAVSHDLRTPITSLRLIAEGLEDGIFEPERTREQLARMTTHISALSALIDDLLELTRLQSGEMKWAIERVALDELVRETVDAMLPQAETGHVAVRAELDANLAPARGNPEQLQRVLFNLIQNAIRHTPADGSVVVRAQSAPGHVVEVEVADTGEGISAEDRERIFEPLVQGSARAARNNGSAGLGLAIARAIVEAHGGRIWLADAAAGTRVCFCLPEHQ